MGNIFRSCRRPKPVYTVDDLVHPSFNNTWNYKAIIFQGGGPNGVIYAGAIKALEDLKILSKIDYFAGTSIGSVFASLGAVRVGATNIINDIMTTDFSTFTGGPAILEDAMFFKYLGLYNGDIFENWMGGLLKKYTGSADITFQQVYAKYGSELVIPNCCINDLQIEYKSRKSSPDLMVRTAVRYSTTIPLAFRAVKDSNLHYHMDGGFGDNYPIDVFDSEIDPVQVIGFKNMTADQTEDNTIINKLPFAITGMESYVTALLYFNSTLSDRTKILLQKSNLYWSRTIRLLSPNRQLTDFNMTAAEKNSYIQSGYQNCIDQITNMVNSGSYRPSLQAQ